MKIIGYIRVSTDQQSESSLGLEAQKKAIEDYALKRGRSIDGFYQDEGISGSLSLDKRPGILNAAGQGSLYSCHDRICGCTKGRTNNLSRW